MSQSAAFAVGRQWGWLSVNDIRKKINLNPVANGDIDLQPMNMIEAGKQPEPMKESGKGGGASANTEAEKE